MQQHEGGREMGAFDDAWLLMKSILNRPDIDSLFGALTPDWTARNFAEPVRAEVYARDHDEAYELMEGMRGRIDMPYLDTADYFQTGGEARMRELLREIERGGTGILGDAKNLFDRQTGQGERPRMDPRVFAALLTDPEAYEILGLKNPTETGTLMGDAIERYRGQDQAVPLGGMSFDATRGDIGMMSLTPGMGGLGLGQHLMGVALQASGEKRLTDRLFTPSGASAFDSLGMKAIGDNPTVTFVPPRSEYSSPRLSLAGDDFTYERPLLKPGAESMTQGSLDAILEPEYYSNEDQERMVRIGRRQYLPQFPGRYPVQERMSLTYAGDDPTPITDIEVQDVREAYRNHPLLGGR